MNLKYRLGLRAIKTAISVFLCLLAARILGRPDALLATIASIICIQQTYKETFRTGLQRLLGTLIGGFVGYIMLFIFHNMPDKSIGNLIIAPVSVLITIYLCNLINHPASVVIACIVTLSVVMWPTENITDPLLYVINRVADTSMGIVIAMFVNRFIFKKKSKEYEALLD